MPLVIPVLAGPLTEWSDTLLVEGAMPGATVRVRSTGPNPRDIAQGTAAGGRDRFALLPGVKLQNHDHLLLRQELGAEASGWTPANLGTPVGPAPASHGQLPPPSIKTRLWRCGAKVWVKGAAPGALVTVTAQGGVLASGRANEGGDARLNLAAGLAGPGQAVQARQDAPPGFPPLTGTAQIGSRQVENLPVAQGDPLPAPVLGGAQPKACDPAIRIAGVYDGALVTIRRRSDGSTETVVFDLDRLNLLLVRPLDGGDTLEITQAFPLCEWPPSEPLVVEVAPATKPATPAVSPPCAGSVAVPVGNLLGGATVTLTYKSQDYRGVVPPTASSFVFQLAPLDSDETIAVRQERCGIVSDAAVVTIPGLSPGVVTKPDIAEPLFACARVVRVTAPPKTWIVVWADGPNGPGPISDKIRMVTASARLAVTPYLHEGQEVWVAFLLCGAGSWENSAHHWVGPAQHTGPANFTLPLVEGATSVSVDAVPGAAVDVHSVSGMPIKTEHIGSGFVDPMVRRIALTRPLVRPELVFAEQRMCSERPGVGAARPVLPGVCHFALAAPISRMSPVGDMKPLVCSSAAVVLRHSGGFELTAFLKNQAGSADCTFVLTFTLQGVAPPFGASVTGELSSPGLTQGMALYGTPSKQSFSQPGSYAAFQDPAYWDTVLNAVHKFELSTAWKDYGGYAEEPDYEEKDEDKPDTPPNP
jgi:hypothetical protein